MTCDNANVAGDIRYGGRNNCNVSSNNANVAGDIRYAGDRINNVPVQRRPVALATPPAAFVRPLQANYYAAITL